MEILLDTRHLTDPGVRDAVLRAWDLPYGIADKRSPVLPLLDLDAVGSHLSSPISTPFSMVQRSVYSEVPVRLNAWLTLHDVKLDGIRF